MKQVRLFVKGDVIGVGFRALTAICAKKNKVRGFVRNVYNNSEIFGALGGVEIIAQGSGAQLKKMIEEIKVGSSNAHVDSVEIVWEEPNKIFDNFKIIR